MISDLEYWDEARIRHKKKMDTNQGERDAYYFAEGSCWKAMVYLERLRDAMAVEAPGIARPRLSLPASFRKWQDRKRGKGR